MINLYNERLSVEIAEPGTAYRGARFDWSGFITQVTLDEKHSFCMPESLKKGEGSGGIGMCNEFGIFRPIGYEEARCGEQFPKLGVGLLTKTEATPHDFFADYPVSPFPVRVETEKDRAVFTVEPLPCRGYAARLKKTISLNGGNLSIGYELENLGDHALRTHEYCHNFVAINGHAPGPDYSLRLNHGLLPPDAPAPLLLSGNELRWRTTPAEPFRIEFSGDADSARAMWQLTHEPSGIGVSESVDVGVTDFVLWCAPHLISPEVFVDIDLPPGETRKWTRQYMFFNS